MAQIKVTARHVDGTAVDAVVLPVHRIAFERQFKVPFMSLRDEPFDERLMWLGWFTTTRGRQGAPAFDAWLETLEAVDIEVAEVDANPLDETASSGTSLPAPSSPEPGSHTTG